MQNFTRSEIRTDVIVIGAGFSGLMAAARLHEAGQRVLVFEARNRVGGRVCPGEIAGYSIDRGGMWISTQNRRLVTLASQAGVQTYPMPLEGKGVGFFLSGRNEFSDEHVLGAMTDAAQEAFGVIVERAEQMGRTIDVTAPWTAEAASEWDSLSLAAWVASQTDDAECRQAWEVVAHGVLCCNAADVSLLFFLYYIQSGGGFATQVSNSGDGANANLVRGGVHQLAEYLARSLTDSLRLSEAVRAIAQDEAGVVVETAKGMYSACHVIVALPPPLASRIHYTPALPSHRDALTQKMPMGSVIKTWIAYPEPFWRKAGFNGLIFSLSHGFEAVYDATPPGDGPGLLVGFFDAGNAVIWSARTAEERRAEILRCLIDAFGPDAAHPSEMLETDWTAEEWSRGCFGAYAPPGVLSSVGGALRAPFGRIHWAGTETGQLWTGYMEGALEAGERAAGEVLMALSEKEG